MKYFNIILLITCYFANFALAQPADSPAASKAVFGYAQHELVEPFRWEGIGTEQLVIVDANNTRVVFYPRPNIDDTEYLARKKTFVQAKLDSIRAEHDLHQRALTQYKVWGAQALIDEYQADPTVKNIEAIAEGEFKVTFKNGDVEFLQYASSNRYVFESREQVHRKLIDKFEAELARGESIWFGTSHYTHKFTDQVELDLYREAVGVLKSGDELSVEQQETVAANKGVQFDAKN